MNNLILVRHGQSEWNLENRFTGWVDVDLAPKGKLEACKAGELIKELNLEITNRLEILEVKAPPERGGSVKMLDNYSDLIDVLKNKEGIL